MSLSWSQRRTISSPNGRSLALRKIVGIAMSAEFALSKHGTCVTNVARFVPRLVDSLFGLQVKWQYNLSRRSLVDIRIAVYLHVHFVSIVDWGVSLSSNCFVDRAG